MTRGKRTENAIVYRRKHPVKVASKRGKKKRAKEGGEKSRRRGKGREEIPELVALNGPTVGGHRCSRLGV